MTFFKKANENILEYKESPVTGIYLLLPCLKTQPVAIPLTYSIKYCSSVSTPGVYFKEVVVTVSLILASLEMLSSIFLQMFSAHG